MTGNRRGIARASSARRAFLEHSLAAGALMGLPCIVPARALGRQSAAPAGERIALGVIGFGPRCSTVLGAMLPEPDLQVRALCDVQAARRTAGKDVYSEKPCAMAVADCQQLAAAMQRGGRVFQAGTQRRSIGNFELAVQLARSGRLGRLRTLHASVYTSSGV